jgi:hypothetical protein
MMPMTSSMFTSNFFLHMQPTVFFSAYILGLLTICVLLNKFTPMPSNNTNVGLALWALGMLGAGTLIGIILPTAFFDEVLRGQYVQMWLYRLAQVFGGACGLYIGFRGRILIAQVSMIGFLGFCLFAFVMWVFGYLKV